MAGINKVILIGHLGKDPETRYFPNGEAVANFSLATSKRWKDKSGEPKEHTEWHNIVAFGKLAEICAEYLTKGSKVYVEGHLKTDKYTDKNGVVKYITKIIVENLNMIGDGSNEGKKQKPQNQSLKHQDFDDDIPF